MKYCKNKSDLFIEGENWKPIFRYEGIYEVSDLGRVKRLVGANCLKERILNVGKVSNKQCRVTLSKKDIKEFRTVHRLVATAFIPNPFDLPNVCHEDDDPNNNAASNLWWGTQKDNIRDCHRKGRASNNLPKNMVGEKNPNYGKPLSVGTKLKLSLSIRKISDESMDAAIKEYKNSKISMRDIQAKYGISPSVLSTMISGKNNRVKLKELK